MKTSLIPRAVIAAVVLVTAGCGIRLATPVPTPPVPDQVEQIRSRTVADALALASEADSVATSDTNLAGILTDIADFSLAQAEALGGAYVYDPGTSTPSPSSTPDAAPVDPSELLEHLAETTRTATTDANTVKNSATALMVSAIVASRTELTRRLAQALAVPVPDLAVSTPEPSQEDLPKEQLQALILAHDQTAYALEVIAARTGGDPSTGILASATAHRTRATQLAVLAKVDGTPDDPRRAIYDLPGDQPDAELAMALETAVADAAAATVGAAPAGSRTVYLADLISATNAAATWGAPPEPLPGVPTTPSPSPTP